MIRTYSNGSKLTLKSRIDQKYIHLCTKFNPSLSYQKKYNLTISEKFNFVWYRVAKVGTRSIFAEFNNLNIPLSAHHAVSCYLPHAKYKNYFKFAFARDPLNRFISGWKDKILNLTNNKNYFDLDSKQIEKMRDINYFIDIFFLDKKLFCNDVHFRPQSELIDLNNIDFIGRLENFENDHKYVLKRIGFKDLSPKAPHKNKTEDSHHDSLKLIKRSNKEKIIKFYYKDFSIFGYK